MREDDSGKESSKKGASQKEAKATDAQLIEYAQEIDMKFEEGVVLASYGPFLEAVQAITSGPSGETSEGDRVVDGDLVLQLDDSLKTMKTCEDTLSDITVPNSEDAEKVHELLNEACDLYVRGMSAYADPLLNDGTANDATIEELLENLKKARDKHEEGAILLNELYKNAGGEPSSGENETEEPSNEEPDDEPLDLPTEDDEMTDAERDACIADVNQC